MNKDSDDVGLEIVSLKSNTTDDHEVYSVRPFKVKGHEGNFIRLKL